MRLYEKLRIKKISKDVQRAVKRYLNGRKLCVLKVCEESYQLSKHLANIGIAIELIMDIDANIYDEYWLGMKMITLNEYNPKAHYLLIWDEQQKHPVISKVLNKKTSRAVKDFIVLKGGYILDLIGIVDHINGIRKGWGVYSSIKGNVGKKMPIIVCPYPGTGDAYLTGMFFEQFIGIKGYLDYRVIVPGNGFKKILTLFGINDSNINVISIHDMNNLKNYVSYKGEGALGLDYLMYWGLPYQKAALFEGYKGLSFPEMFKACTFCLSKDTEPNRMRQDISLEDAELQIKEMGLDPGNTVVVAPYANSFVKELEDKWWEELVLELQNRGFFVVTNCNGKDEKPIKNTRPVAFPYNSILPLMDVCGYFIGMRSGLCDIISASTCKKTIIYQNAITSRRMDFFSLFHLNENQELKEYKFMGQQQDRLLLDILKGGFFEKRKKDIKNTFL